MKLGLTVQENEDVADGTLDHIGRAQAMGNGCGRRRARGLSLGAGMLLSSLLRLCGVAKVMKD